MRWLVAVFFALLFACPWSPANAQSDPRRVSELIGTFTANGALVVTGRNDVEFALVGTWGGGTVTPTCRIHPTQTLFAPVAGMYTAIFGTAGATYTADAVIKMNADYHQCVFTMSACVGCSVSLYTLSRENRR